MTYTIINVALWLLTLTGAGYLYWRARKAAAMLDAHEEALIDNDAFERAKMMARVSDHVDTTLGHLSDYRRKVEKRNLVRRGFR